MPETNWTPELGGHAGPRYAAIAEALADDIGRGRLAPGSRLPTHRDLAWRLGVTVGTVSRAYAEAERRGLIHGEVGRGTFVRERAATAPRLHGGEAGGFVDLSYNLPHPDPALPRLADALSEVARSPDLASLLAYRFDSGMADHRAAAAAWVGELGVPAEPDDMVMTYGAQNAMLLAMMALAGPGATLLTEALTYYGIKTIGAHLDLRLHGVAMDGQGLLPDALDAACRSTGAKVLYCVPTLQNPTAAVMGEERRRAILEVAERHGLAIVEDDVYGFLMESPPPPLAALAPERVVYLTSLSKCVAPGLRLGLLRAAPAHRRLIDAALRAASLCAPALSAEVGARLIRAGEVRRMAHWQRCEARRRQRAAARLLAGQSISTHPDSFHLWLALPEPWRREIFTAEARGRGVGVAPAEVFAVGRRPAPQAVRLCLQAARGPAEMERALGILADMLAGQPAGGPALV